MPMSFENTLAKRSSDGFKQFQNRVTFEEDVQARFAKSDYKGFYKPQNSIIGSQSVNHSIADSRHQSNDTLMKNKFTNGHLTPEKSYIQHLGRY
jgi:hypothetical protein